MDIKLIKTDEDYQAALQEIERFFDADPDTPEGDQLEVLVTLVEAYEDKHYPIPLPDPIEAIEYHMESRGLSRRDLEPYIGSRARVSEVLNRRRHLTLRMMRNLETGLGIPAEILIQGYDLQPYGQAMADEDVLEEEQGELTTMPGEEAPTTVESRTYLWVPEPKGPVYPLDLTDVQPIFH